MRVRSLSGGELVGGAAGSGEGVGREVVIWLLRPPRRVDGSLLLSSWLSSASGSVSDTGVLARCGGLVDAVAVLSSAFPDSISSPCCAGPLVPVPVSVAASAMDSSRAFSISWVVGPW